MKHIPFLDLTPSPRLASELNAAYDRVLNSGRYIGGLEVERFEHEWSEYCGANYCVGVGNGHDALALSCKYFDESDPFTEERYYNEQYLGVIHGAFTPWKTCLPTWVAVENGGFSPVLTNKLQHTVAIAVHIYGQITLPDASPDIPWIEDCAQAHGASLNGVKAGKFGQVAAWSFYPTKCLGALGDAGAITTDDPEIADFVRVRSNYGTSSDTGINSRLDPLQAAFLRVKLPYLDEWNKRRLENALAYYRTIPSGIIDVPIIASGSRPSWHIFAIETDNRDDLASYLREHGVETIVHYPRVPYHPINRIPEAERWVSRTLSLPIAPHVTPEDCRQIGELINQWTRSRVS